MRVSVIIPWHRDPEDLGRALASVLVQQGAELEVIVVANGVDDALFAEAGRRITDPRCRLVRLTTAGASAARKFDCEAWVPTQQTYRELTSTSNCTTFQARRLSTRYRDDNGKPQIAATLNGTLATTRWLVAILENHQQPDGSVRVPAALVPYVGTEVLQP